MNILVTGGAGYIGSHTVVELIQAGHHPIIVDDLSNAHRDVRDRIGQICDWLPALYEIDCADKKELQKVFHDRRVAAGKLEKLTIFGGDYDTPDGTCQRDYLHVVDLAVGHLKALEYAANHDGVEAINLGTGNGVSVLELVNAFQKVNGNKLPCTIGPRREGDLPAFWADAAKARELLGWEATHSVEDMCRSSWIFAQNAAQ